MEPEAADLVEELEMLLGELPGVSRIEELLANLQIEVEEEAERYGGATRE